MIKLMIKIHTKTGIKYFCKTGRSDPFKYRGSGTWWVRHISKHGFDSVYTIVVGEYEESDPQLIIDALEFSHANNIVKSPKWANLELENGVDGRPIKWNLGEVMDIMPHFTSKRLVELEYPGILNAAKREGVYNNLIKSYTKDNIIWTFDEVMKEANKYTSKQQFNKNSPKAADAARKWWGEVTKHMIDATVRTPKYDIALAIAEVKTYNHRDECTRLSVMGKWLQRTHRDIWDKNTSHMVNPRVMEKSYQEIHEDLSQSKSRTDFNNNFSHSYKKLVKINQYKNVSALYF